MGKFYEYPLPSIIVGTEKLVISQSSITKSVPLDNIVDDLGLMKDIDINNPQTGDGLIYNSTSGKWENGPISGGTTGWSGTFTAGSGEIVTVVDGVITNAEEPWYNYTNSGVSGMYGTGWNSSSNGWTFAESA